MVESESVEGTSVSKRSADANERAAKVAAMRAQQDRRDRRNKRLIIGGALALCLALVAAVAVPLVNAQRERSAIEAAANAPIDGVEEFADLSATHVETPVTYEQTPPVGGDHNPTWLNCGVYTEPVPNENAVHSLEHGAVWVTYDPELSADQVEILADVVGGESYGLLSPMDGLPSPIVASAWGLQLQLDDPDDPRLEAFLAKYLQGEQTPEPGAACFGGVGVPVA